VRFAVSMLCDTSRIYLGMIEKEIRIEWKLNTTRNIKNWAESGKYEHFNNKWTA
jgi:hypothetical protein